MMNLILAWEIVGGLSKPSKMPCYGYSIPAKYCNIGARLRHVKGSVCSKCYALKGRYIFGVVKTALEKRFVAMRDEPRWVEAMVFLINHYEKSGFFRWFDSGDVQDVECLNLIMQVIRQTPHIHHWLPTREYTAISDWLDINGAFPSNVTVRLSALMIDGEPPVSIAQRLGVLTSGVKTKDYDCVAPKQKNQCLACCACWDKNVPNVNYKAH